MGVIHDLASHLRIEKYPIARSKPNLFDNRSIVNLENPIMKTPLSQAVDNSSSSIHISTPNNPKKTIKSPALPPRQNSLSRGPNTDSFHAHL